MKNNRRLYILLWHKCNLLNFILLGKLEVEVNDYSACSPNECYRRKWMYGDNARTRRRCSVLQHVSVEILQGFDDFKQTLLQIFGTYKHV